MSIDLILKDIDELIHENKITVVGIDGPGGAGKTTLANKIKSKLEKVNCRVVVLHIDDFITDRSVRYNKNFEEWYCYYIFQWRYNYLIEKVLKSAKENNDIDDTIELYEKHEDVYREENIRVSKGDLIVIEGVFLQRAEMREYFDYTIYVHADRETIVERVLKRDSYIGNKEEILNKYNNRYFPAEDRYIKTVSPQNICNVVFKS